MKGFFLPLSAGFHQLEIECPSKSTRLSDLHSAEGCHSLEVSFTEIYTFFIFYKPGSFFINALSLTNILYSGMKNKLSLCFSDIQKKIEKNWRVILRIRRR